MDKMLNANKGVSHHDMSKRLSQDGTAEDEDDTPGEGMKLKAKIVILGEDLDAANDAMKLITAEAAKEFADGVTDSMTRTMRRLDEKQKAVGTDFGTKVCDSLMRPKEALKLHAGFVEDARAIVQRAVQKCAAHEALFLKHIREHSGFRLSELVAELVERQNRVAGRNGGELYVDEKSQAAIHREAMDTLRTDLHNSTRELGRMKEQAGASEFAFAEADRARADKMKALKQAAREQARCAEMAAKFAEKEHHLKEVNAKAEKLQVAMTEVVSQVETLESQREEMKQAVEAIKTMTGEKEMKSMKTGQLVGKMAAKLASRVNRPKDDLDAWASKRKDAQAQANEIYKVTTMTSSINVLSSAIRLKNKLKASVAVTKPLGNLSPNSPRMIESIDEGHDRHNPEVRLTDAAGTSGTRTCRLEPHSDAEHSAHSGTAEEKPTNHNAKLPSSGRGSSLLAMYCKPPSRICCV